MSVLISGVSNAGMVCTTHIRNTREKEKREMGSLNDRLADYIEKVRFLTAQNHCLTTDIAFLKQGFGTKSQVSGLFDSEVIKTQQHLHQINSSRVHYEKDLPVLSAEIDVLRKKWLDSLKIVRAHREDHHIDLDKLAKIEAESSVYVRKIRVVDEDVHRVRRENEGIHRKLSEIHTLVRSECSRKNEQSSSIQNLLHRVKAAQSENATVISQEIRFIGRDTTTENRDYFRHELQAAMRDIRASYETLALRNRQEIEEWYRQKLAIINGKKDTRSGFEYKHEAESIRVTLNNVRSHLAQIEAKNRFLESRIDDLTSDIKMEAKNYELQLAEKDAVNAKIRQQCEELSHQMEKLCDHEITLRAEIEKYESLLPKFYSTMHFERGLRERSYSSSY